MPRVTKREQYKRHLFLRTVWIGPVHQACLAVLSANEQWKLHAFYRPDEDLTVKQFRDHLCAMRQDRPELFHVSGKLYRHIEVAFVQQTRRTNTQQHKQSASPKSARSKVPAWRQGGQVTIHGVLRPKPDLNKLLKAMIQMPREDQAKDNKSKT
jgi:hypothetical protein